MTEKNLRAQYFNRYGFNKRNINKKPKDNLGGIIVIPSYDENQIEKTLHSLLETAQPKKNYEVIIVINYPENETIDQKSKHNHQFNSLIKWSENSSKKHIDFIPILAGNLNDKNAGVGLARKIGMDEAASRLKEDNLIICLDADCEVAENYLLEIEDYFKLNPIISAASIYFEHPFTELSPKLREGIIHYELFLRYYIQAQKRINYPYAYHTVGSSMATRVNAYFKIGGMNTRKAGEDFYFINRLIKLGNFGSIINTAVSPSARTSQRVPFGTGRAMINWIEEDKFITYHPSVFLIISTFINSCFDDSAEISANKLDVLTDYCSKNNIHERIGEIRERSTTKISYKKNFYDWFDSFQFMKMANHLRDEKKLHLNIYDAALKLGSLQSVDFPSTESLLIHYRHLDRNDLTHAIK